MKCRFIFATVLLLFACSCGNLGKSFKEMMSLRKAIADKYNVENVGVNLDANNGKTNLVVKLINSRFNDSSAQCKQKLADSIGQICQANLHSTKVIGGQLVFANEHNYVVANSSSAESFDMHMAESK